MSRIVQTAAAPTAHAGRCVLVLGMHRSGTSMLAGTLAAGGVHLGRVLETPFALNPTGLREPEALIHMHEDLLRANGGAWDAPPAQVDWSKLHLAVRDLFIEARARAGLWGFKDPRTLLVAEGWIAALADWTAVGIFRHPAAVAASLAHRNGFAPDKGLALWAAYNRRLLALQHAHGFPLLEFRADGCGMRADLAAALGRLGGDRAAAGQVLDAALPRHGAAGADAALPPEIAALLAQLRAAARPGAAGEAGQGRSPETGQEGAQHGDQNRGRHGGRHGGQHGHRNGGRHGPPPPISGPAPDPASRPADAPSQASAQDPAPDPASAPAQDRSPQDRPPGDSARGTARAAAPPPAAPAPATPPATAAAPAPVLLSTRLFPKGRGAEAYRIDGIAAQCDWVVLSDSRAPHTALRRQRPTERPRHVFVSLREPFAALRFFATGLLPRLTAPFVLISGSEDVTVPRQTDRRWRPFDAAERALIDGILAHPLLIRWWAENLDEAGHPRLAPLPLGMVRPDGPSDPAAPLPAPPPLGPRPLRIFCAHRLRPGPQWETRRQVGALARGPWAAFTTQPTQELSEAAFRTALESHSFVLCAEGGGLDPAPKAWSALLHGAIPIIRDTPVAAAYRRLPVVVVPDWQAGAITPARLAGWKRAFAPEFDRPERRAALLDQLGLAAWWQRIAAEARRETGD